MSGSTFTPNFRLAKPPFDTIPWDQAVNGNMDIIDSALARYLSIPNFVGNWRNTTAYTPPQTVNDPQDGTLWQCVIAHTSPNAPTTFAQDRIANPTRWTTGAATALNPGVVISDNPPVATQGTIWWNSRDGQLYVYYDDGSSKQWVTASNIGGFPNVATKDDVAAAQNNVGRNLLHNPLFNIAQRGAGAFSTSGTYTLDRWFLAFNLDTTFVQQGQFNDANRVTIGDEEANNFLTVNATGNAGAASFSLVSQSIENVRRLAGKTVTVSFWASAAAGTPKLGIGMRQYFGTGGSPSALVDMTGQSVTLTTGTPTRYSVTFSLPSIAAKTLGTNRDDLTRLSFWPSSGTTNATIAGNPGVQTCTIALWGVQLEVGSVMTPLEKPDPRHDLANCQRFYQIGSAMIAGYNSPGAGLAYMYSFPVTMRAVPNVVLSSPSVINTGTPTAPATGAWGFQFQAIVTAQASAFASAIWAASADL